MNKTLNFILLFSVLTTIFLAACAGPITIDVGGGGGGTTGDGNVSGSSQIFFILMLVLLVAMFAMVLVAVSR